MSNKHVRHVGKKEKARRLAQSKKRAAAARKKAPKKRPVVQEPEPREAQSLQQTYEDASRGMELPEVLVTNGGVLNKLTDTADFDPGEAYMVTAEGIDPLRSDE